MTQHIDPMMEEAVRKGIFPSADLLVAKHGEIVHHNHYGDARTGTAFDIASLTKPIATATLTMLLCADGRLSTDQTLDRWFDGVDDDHRHITIDMLLNHRSGLPAWKPFYRELPSTLIGTEEGRQFIIYGCLGEPLAHAPDTQTLYSDIGYILLGEIIAKAAGVPLDELFAKRIAEPLGLANTLYVHNRGDLRTTARRTDTAPDQHVPTRDSSSRDGQQGAHRRFSATEDCPWRGRVVHGEVHDQNAYAMGGVAGHAGLFSTAEDIHRFILAFMGGFRGEGHLVSSKTLVSFFPLSGDLITPPEPGCYVGGWDTPAAMNSAAGHYSSPHAIGHLAYTGCSVWIDQEQDFWVIFLTNRIHPSTTNERIKAFRPRIHDLIYTTLIA